MLETHRTRWANYAACLWAILFAAPHAWWALDFPAGFPGGEASYQLNEADPRGISRNRPQRVYVHSTRIANQCFEPCGETALRSRVQEQRSGDDDFTEQAGSVHFGDARRNSEISSDPLKRRLVRSCGTKAVFADNHPFRVAS